MTERLLILAGLLVVVLSIAAIDLRLGGIALGLALTFTGWTSRSMSAPPARQE